MVFSSSELEGRENDQFLHESQSNFRPSSQSNKRSKKMNKLKLAFLVSTLVMTTLKVEADDYSVISTDNIDWGLLNPLRGDASPRAADLWGDRTKDMATGMLVKFKKGFSSPPHIHNISYRGVIIEGLLHNDDPTAEKLWLTTGSFWTQPAGETHITAADGQENLIYLEIDSGPYLVLSEDKAFDNGERPINVDQRNLVWLEASDMEWLNKSNVKIAHLRESLMQLMVAFLNCQPTLMAQLRIMKA